jgi:hypothetical protein
MKIDLPAGGELPKTLPARLAEKMESIGVSPMKALEYLALFVVLGTIYYCDLTRDWKQSICTPDQVITFSELPVIMFKFLVFTAWPFAIVAALDPTWRSRDAGNVFPAAYIGANALWFHHTGCGFCVFAASFRIIPFVFCALIAHSLGAWRHRSRVEE